MMDVRILTRPITAQMMKEASAELVWIEWKVRAIENSLAEKAGKDNVNYPEWNYVDEGIYDLVPSETTKRWSEEAVARGQKDVSEYTEEQVREMFWNDKVEELSRVFTERGFTVSLKPYYSYARGICCDIKIAW